MSSFRWTSEKPAVVARWIAACSASNRGTSGGNGGSDGDCDCNCGGGGGVGGGGGGSSWCSRDSELSYCCC